jgi:hypothetical protein
MSWIKVIWNFTTWKTLTLAALNISLLEEGSEGKQHKAGPESMPKPPPIYMTDVKNTSPPIYSC